MNFGTIKEVKTQENRVGLTPSLCKLLIKKGHRVYVEKDAGNNAGFSNDEYKKAGAKILANAKAVAKKVDVLVKVKEPLPKEYQVLRALKGKTLFTYLHLAAAPIDLTKELLKNKITAIAYETVEEHGTLPLLKPMSQIAGVLAVQYGAHYLQLKYKGRGTTLGNIDNAPLSTTVIIGAGNVGTTAAATALGMGGNVILLTRSQKGLVEAEDHISATFSRKQLKRITFLESTPKNISASVKAADLLVGAVLVPGAHAPQVVTEKMIKSMKKGAVIVDVAIDQGGCIYGSKQTNHDKPTYIANEKVYCNIPNMPGQVARQSTEALTNATRKYLELMADHGVAGALKKDKGLAKGVNTYYGSITYKAVADALKLPYQEIVS